MDQKENYKCRLGYTATQYMNGKLQVKLNFHALVTLTDFVRF